FSRWRGRACVPRGCPRRSRCRAWPTWPCSPTRGCWARWRARSRRGSTWRRSPGCSRSWACSRAGRARGPRSSCPGWGRSRSRPWLALGLGLLGGARASAWPTPAVLALVACATWALWAWNPASLTRPLPHRFARGEPPYPPEPPRATGLAAELAHRCGPEPARVLAPGLIWDGAAITERVELVQGYPESIAPGRMQRLLGELSL